MSEGSCRVIPAGGLAASERGLEYAAGISAESAGSTRLCMHLGVVPLGARGELHAHLGRRS